MSSIDHAISSWIDGLDWPLFGLIRIAVAALCGGLVGLEREVRGRQAGFRTNVLVCVGCAVVMVVSTQMVYVAWPDRFGLSIDPARIAYGVMGGIGFLGAGVIVQNKATVRGLTTAAGIWCVAGIGLASGLGLYLFALMATAVAISVLWLLDIFEGWLPRMYYRAVVIRRRWDEDCVKRTVSVLRDAGYRVPNWSFKRIGDLKTVDITIIVGFRSKHHFDDIDDHLPKEANAELVSVREG